jgi:hypothetical protein
MIRRALLLLALALLVLPLAAGNCFPRQCLDHTNCERFCECEDAQTNRVLPCTMFFRCDESAGVCADEYGMSCDQVCQEFAATDTCGRKTCDNEVDCLRLATCQVNNQTTGEVLCTFSCEIPFTCENGSTCAAEYVQDDQTVCAQFCVPPAGCG